MHLFDLSLLPRLLTDQSIDDTPADHALRAQQLDALHVALLPIGMRVVCLETVGIVTGWDTAPIGDRRRVPYLSRTVPHAFAPEQAFSPASSTYLPASRAKIIVDAATIPHLCRVIAESVFGWAPWAGEVFGLHEYEAGRWRLASTHGARWELGSRLNDLTPGLKNEEIVILLLSQFVAEIAHAFAGRAPEGIPA